MATRNANSPGTKLLSVSVVMSASSSQPTTSLTAAALMAITPRRVRVRLNSIMMRPRMGRAVMEKAVATNSAVLSMRGAGGLARPAEVRRQEVAERDAARERQRETGEGHARHRRPVRPLGQVREIEFEPDLKHQEHEAELREDEQRFRRRGMKYDS